MATYATDLVVLATGSDGESGTWTEFTGWASGGTPGAETENYIQGTQSQSQTFGNAVTGKSICFDAGSDISSSIPSGDVVVGWVFMGAGTNLYSYASGGHRFGIGTSVANFDMWSISGDDRTPNPYGGWWSVAIDPSATSDYTGGTGSGGAWRYFGSLIGDTTLGIRVKIAKGNPHAVDGLRMGRGEIYCTGTGATFTGMAQENDYNDVTNGYNRWGLFSDTGGGTFTWKGLMSLGQSGTSTTFSDSNKSITVEDAAKTYAAFNKIEIRNASSSITWTNISFFALGTLSPGQFEMVENATVTMSGCSFNNMDTFIFDSNATVTSCSWNGCDQITHGGADFDSCSFAGFEGTAGTAYMLYAESVDPDGELDNCSFTKGTAATHAIEFDATNTPTTITLRGVDFSGYNASNGQNDSTLYFPSTAKSYTVNLIGCTGNISYRVGAGGSVNLVTDPITVTVTVTDEDAAAIENAHVYMNKPTSVQAYSADTGNTAGNGALIVNETVDTGLPQEGWCLVWVKSLNALQGYRYASWATKTFTFPTTVSGTANIGGSSTTLKRKTGTAFTSANIEVGDTVRNTTDTQWAVVDEIVDDDTITTTPLSGSASWDEDDGYSFHDLATTLTDNDDLVDIPFSQQKTNASGVITQQIADNTFDLLIRTRYTEGGTKYDYDERTQAIGTDDVSVGITLFEQSGIT